MPEMHLRKPKFTLSASESFTKNKERIQKFNETGDSRYIYQNEQDEACFQHDMAYGDFKNLTINTTFNKILRDKAFNTAKNRKYDGCQRGLASMSCKNFDKKTSGSHIKKDNMSNQQLAERLNKPIIRNLMKRKVH